MLNGISNITKNLRSVTLFDSNKICIKFLKTNKYDDSLQISTNSLESIRVQAATLKNQLPELNSGSLIEAIPTHSSSQDPLSSFINQVVNPARVILNVSGQKIPSEQLVSFRNEIKEFQRSLPHLLSNELLIPLTQDSMTAGNLNRLLNSFSNELTSLADFLRQKTE